MSNQISIQAAETLEQLTSLIRSASKRIVHNAMIHLGEENGSSLLYEATYVDVKDIISAGDFIRYFPLLVSEIGNIAGVKKVNGCRRWHGSDLYPNNVSKTAYRKSEILLDSDVMALGIDVFVESKPKTLEPVTPSSVLKDFLFGNPPANTIAIRGDNSHCFVFTKVPCGNSGKVWAIYDAYAYIGNESVLPDGELFCYSPELPDTLALSGYCSDNGQILSLNSNSSLRHSCFTEIEVKSISSICSELADQLIPCFDKMTMDDFKNCLHPADQKRMYENTVSAFNKIENCPHLAGNVERFFASGGNEFSAFSMPNVSLFKLLNHSDHYNYCKSYLSPFSWSEFACFYFTEPDNLITWVAETLLWDSTFYIDTLKQKIYTGFGRDYFSELKELYDNPFVIDFKNIGREDLRFVFNERRIREVIKESGAKNITVSFEGKRKKIYTVTVPAKELMEQRAIHHLCSNPTPGLSDEARATLIMSGKDVLNIRDICAIKYRGKTLWEEKTYN